MVNWYCYFAETENCWRCKFTYDSHFIPFHLHRTRMSSIDITQMSFDEHNCTQQSQIEKLSHDSSNCNASNISIYMHFCVARCQFWSIKTNCHFKPNDDDGNDKKITFTVYFETERRRVECKKKKKKHPEPRTKFAMTILSLICFYYYFYFISFANFFFTAFFACFWRQ